MFKTCKKSSFFTKIYTFICLIVIFLKFFNCPVLPNTLEVPMAQLRQLYLNLNFINTYLISWKIYIQVAYNILIKCYQFQDN